MSTQTDAMLVKLSLEQGSQYFANLVKRHSDYLYGLGMRLSGGNDAQAKDLSQQALIKAFRYLSSFDPKHAGLGSDPNKRFRNWLTGIAVNCFGDLARKEAQYIELNEEEIEDIAVRAPSSDHNEFYQMIRPLTLQERQLVTLRFIYEFTIDEIAGMLNLKGGTVKSKISRAVARLKQQHTVENTEEANHA